MTPRRFPRICNISPLAGFVLKIRTHVAALSAERCRALNQSGARCRYLAPQGSQLCTSHTRSPPDPEDVVVALPRKSNGSADAHVDQRYVEVSKAEQEERDRI
jgi:hypothetical protein